MSETVKPKTPLFYVIVHEPSGGVIPLALGRAGRGGSHVEPCDPREQRPKLFTTERAAKGWLTTWLKGKVVVSRRYDPGTPDRGEEYYEDTSLVPVPHRRREDMKILSVFLLTQNGDVL